MLVMEYRYTAIILGKRDVGEMDRLYTFFTREGGKVTAKAVGVRKSNAKLCAHLETGNFTTLTVMKQRGMGRIVSAFCEKRYFSEEMSFEVSQEVMHILSLLNRIIEENEKDEALFHLCYTFLEVSQEILQRGEEEKVFLLVQGFLFQLLSQLGMAPHIQKCTSCNKKISGEKIYMSAEYGGVLCNECGSSFQHTFFVTQDTIKLLRLFSSHSLSSLTKIKVSSKHISDVRNLLNIFFARLAR
ncbi:MAG: DNA repair protein RecO [Candidatus Moranbacteria bacterium]|nr:DNA repair protein RecO [Candidatus Moranbacteria bacterium]